MTDFEVSKYSNIYFIGIGGIGMSAIARMFLLEGKRVSGSDLAHSMVTEELEKSGAKIFYSQDVPHVPQDADLVVYTIAIPQDNPDLCFAHEHKIPTFSYPEMLGLISKEKFTIAVSGTHGKTTTTAMIAKIMLDAGLDPTVIVGSFLKDQKSNFIAGKSKYLVVEACEYKRSFLNLNPNILVITNIDDDHLDYYRDMADIQSAFTELASRLGSEDYLVCDPENETIAPVVDSLHTSVQTRGQANKCKIENYTLVNNVGELSAIAGEHNRKNASAALSVALILGIPKEKAIASLLSFGGTWRRFEYKGKTKSGALVYDDYAHHPTEVRAALSLARELFPDKKINVAFQPHLYSRTKDHLNDFAAAFTGADTVLLAPIYAAREPFDPSISSEMVAERIGSSASVFKNLDDVPAALSSLGQESVIITMGAGDIGSVATELVG